ncbi:Ger(x)C family spore germination protein [Thalassobacillus hwangdonensis]|uniref:Ger(X)C family spore germination protein n=1 Tax=Thalassobacillus hwangdonensis TaxID=546108 RepID=A0ABW3L266_9BACI
MPRKWIAAACILLLSGCWDSKEIEDVGIVTGMALDISDDRQELTMINQYVVPGQIPTQNTASHGKPYQNLEMEGDTFFEIIRANSLESNRPPNYTHLKSIVTSTRLFEQERVDQVIDLFIRDHEFRRTVPVFITKDSVAVIFDTEPTKELFPSIQIKDLSENYDKNNIIPKNLSIGDMAQYISEKKSFLIPGISLVDGYLRSTGAGIISAKETKYIGWLPSKSLIGVRYISNDVQGGLIHLDEKMIDQGQITLEVKSANTTFKPSLSDGTLKMKINVEIKTVLAEDWGISRDVYKKGWKAEVEQAANKVVQSDIETVINQAQHEFGVDFLNLSNWVNIHLHEYWEKNEKNWDEIFKQMEVKVDVATKVTDFGTQNLNTK